MHPRAGRRPGGHACGSDPRGRTRESRVHGGRRARAGRAHAGARDPARHDAHAHACRGRPRHRPARLRRRHGARRRVRVRHRPRDLRFSAGGTHRQSGHRGADRGSAEAGRACHWRRAVRRSRSARPDRPRVRSRARLRRADRHAPRLHARRLEDGRRIRMRADATAPLRRSRDDRAREHAVRAAARALRRHGGKARGCRRIGHRPPVDGPVPDGPRHRSRRAARRGARASTRRRRRERVAVDEQRAEPVHALRRLLARAHGEPLREHRPARPAPRIGALSRDDHAPRGADPRHRGFRELPPARRPIASCSTAPMPCRRSPRSRRRSTCSRAGA